MYYHKSSKGFPFSLSSIHFLAGQSLKQISYKGKGKMEKKRKLETKERKEEEIKSKKKKKKERNQEKIRPGER